MPIALVIFMWWRSLCKHSAWRLDDDDDCDDDDDDVGGWVRGADAGTESHRSALHAQEPLPGWRARNLLKSCHSTNTWWWCWWLIAILLIMLMIPTCTWGGWLNWQICEFEVYRFPLVHSQYALEDEQDKDDENVDCSCLANMHLHFCESLLSARVQLDLCFARTKVDFKLHKVASHKPLCQTHHFALLWDPSTCVS